MTSVPIDNPRQYPRAHAISVKSGVTLTITVESCPASAESEPFAGPVVQRPGEGRLGQVGLHLPRSTRLETRGLAFQLHQLILEPATSWSICPVAVSTSSVLFANPELSGFVAASRGSFATARY